MPVIVNCKECGYVLLKKPKVRNWQAGSFYHWYLTMYMSLDGHCPNCNRALPKHDEFAEEMVVDVSPK